MGYYHWQWGCEVRKIQKVGNSHVVVIPASYLERLNLKKGDEVSLVVRRNPEFARAEEEFEVVIKPMKGRGQK